MPLRVVSSIPPPIGPPALPGTQTQRPQGESNSPIRAQSPQDYLPSKPNPILDKQALDLQAANYDAALSNALGGHTLNAIPDLYAQNQAKEQFNGAGRPIRDINATDSTIADALGSIGVQDIHDSLLGLQQQIQDSPVKPDITDIQRQLSAIIEQSNSQVMNHQAATKLLGKYASDNKLAASSDINNAVNDSIKKDQNALDTFVSKQKSQANADIKAALGDYNSQVKEVNANNKELDATAKAQQTLFNKRDEKAQTIALTSLQESVSSNPDLEAARQDVLKSVYDVVVGNKDLNTVKAEFLAEHGRNSADPKEKFYADYYNTAIKDILSKGKPDFSNMTKTERQIWTQVLQSQANVETSLNAAEQATAIAKTKPIRGVGKGS
jgi:hypothetical protein